MGITLRLGAEMPFADRPGSVTGVPKRVGQRNLFDGQAQPLAVAAGRPAGVEFVAEALLVAAGEQPGPRGAADRRRHVAVGEPHSIGGDRIDVRRLQAPATVAADVAVAQIVGQDDDAVRARRAARTAGARTPGPSERKRRLEIRPALMGIVPPPDYTPGGRGVLPAGSPDGAPAAAEEPPARADARNRPAPARPAARFLRRFLERLPVACV